MSTYKLQNRIEVTGRAITGMVVMVWSVTLLTVTSPNALMDGNKSFDSSKESVTRFNSDDIAIIPKAHRAVVTFTQKIVQMQFINLQTFTQDDKLITIPNSTTIWGIAGTSDNIIVILKFKR
jgi:hypothetical protein